MLRPQARQFNQNLEEVVKPKHQHFIEVPGDPNAHPRWVRSPSGTSMRATQACLALLLPLYSSITQPQVPPPVLRL